MAYSLSRADCAFGAALSFVLGTFAASIGWSAWGSVLFFAAALWLGRPALVALFLFIYFLGAVYFSFYTVRRAAHSLPNGKTISFTAVVSDGPKETAAYEIIQAAPTNPSAEPVDLFVSPGRIFHYGDTLKITGKLEPPETPTDRQALFFPKIFLTAHRGGFWLKAFFINFKTAFLEKLNNVLPQDEAALLGGITLGGTAGMPAALKNAMSASGTSYLTTMYGYKIATVVFLLREAFAKVLSHHLLFWFLLFTTAFFIMLSGGNASALRAGTMALFVILAHRSGRVASRRYAILASAFFMLIFDPLLIAQAGFELSFLSILGIVYIAPVIKRLIHYRSPGILEWRESAVIASATLFAMMPVIAGTFGDFSLTAFISNTLVMCFILPLSIFGFAIATAGFVSYYLSFFIARMAELLIWYELAVIKIFAAFMMPLPSFFGTALGGAVYYAALIFFISRYGKERQLERL